ncbi:MAG: hypothetical protein PHI63_05530 [Patescibacteria group bacterium]|nr:hypothetical protein [Patescibacteria group bacterium]
MPSSGGTIPTRPFSNFKLKTSLWFVNHRIALKKSLVMTLAGVSVFLYGYSIIRVLDLARSQGIQRSIINDILQDRIDFMALRPLMLSKPLSVSSVEIMSSVGGTSDLAVFVRNPNSNFTVTSLRYRFLQAGRELASGTGFILPDESKYLFSFAVPDVSGTVQVELSDMVWRRIKVANFQSLRDSHPPVSIQNVKHLSGIDLGPVNKTLGGRTQFTVVNTSVFGYRQVGLYILMKNGDRIAAVQYTAVKDLDPLQRRNVVVNWPSGNPLTTEVAVISEINLYDSNAFYKYQTDGSIPR